MDLTDEQWLLIQPLLPQIRPPGGRGRPQLDQRTLINGILWKLRCNKPWRTVPSHYGSHEACYQRYNAYKKSGVLERMLTALKQDLQTRGKFDFEQCLRSGIVVVVQRAGKIDYYIHSAHSEDWQVSTSLIFYHQIARYAEQKRREK